MWAKLTRRMWTTPAVFLLLAGTGLLIVCSASIQDRFYAEGSLTWPTVQGVVQSSEVELTGASLDTQAWCPRVTYSYTVDGTYYTSDKVQIAPRCDEPTGSFARKVTARYPVGNRVDVHYDPRNPSLAVLEPGVPEHYALPPSMIVAVVAAGTFLFGLGLLILLGVLRLPTGKGRRDTRLSARDLG